VASNRRQPRGYSDTLRLLLFFDGDPKRLIVDRFFSEWDALRDLLPPELGQVGISLKTAELTLHGGAKDAIERGWLRRGINACSGRRPDNETESATGE